jgi:hypothetical protein
MGFARLNPSYALRAASRQTEKSHAAGMRGGSFPSPTLPRQAGEGGAPRSGGGLRSREGGAQRRLRGGRDYAAMASAESSACDDVTDPKMPPCALIIASPAS